MSIAVALADKLDTLVGFWAIDEKPTGSKDPFALRRAALGSVSIILSAGLRLKLLGIVLKKSVEHIELLRKAELEALPEDKRQEKKVIHYAYPPQELGTSNAHSLLAFFADRLKTYLRDKGARHDLIDAVFALPGQDDLVLIVRRVEALGRFLDGEDGRNLLAGARRAANILKAEEKRDGAGAFEAPYDPARFVEPEESALADALAEAGRAATERLAAEDYEGAMTALAALRAPVDGFFERVTVNAEDHSLRVNRLRLLAALRRTMGTLADFGRIAG